MKFSLITKSALLAASFGIALSATTASADASAERFVPSKQLTAVERSLPAYPRLANLHAIEGQAVVEFTVLTDGSVIEPIVANASHSIFVDVVARAIANWKFEPVVEAGTPVAVRSAMRFQFTGAD